MMIDRKRKIRLLFYVIKGQKERKKGRKRNIDKSPCFLVGLVTEQHHHHHHHHHHIQTNTFDLSSHKNSITD